MKGSAQHLSLVAQGPRLCGYGMGVGAAPRAPGSLHFRRLGLLLCFHDDLDALDAAAARVLLHRTLQCGGLRGSRATVRQVGARVGGTRSSRSSWSLGQDARGGG